MRKIIACLVILTLILTVVTAAVGEKEFPSCKGIVTDEALILHDEAEAGLEELSQQLEKSMGGHIYVYTRHFLGTMDADSYAKKVFDLWGLGENDVLLMVAYGEEKYALAMGAKAKELLPGTEALEMMLAENLENEFEVGNRNFDQAVGNVASELAKYLSKNTVTGKSLIDQIFSNATQSSSTDEKSDDSLTENREDNTPSIRHENQVEEHKSNWRTIIIWGLVIYFLFFRKKRRGRR